MHENNLEKHFYGCQQAGRLEWLISVMSLTLSSIRKEETEELLMQESAAFQTERTDCRSVCL